LILDLIPKIWGNLEVTIRPLSLGGIGAIYKPQVRSETAEFESCTYSLLILKIPRRVITGLVERGCAFPTYCRNISIRSPYLSWQS
jgi:hypothetical protein